jgi:hypothetical protein
MGWAYTNAEFGYFHLNPLHLDIGVQEYALRGLNLFSPSLVTIGVTVALLLAGRALLVGSAEQMTEPPRVIHLLQEQSGPLLRATGFVVGIAGLLLFATARHVAVPTYTVLALLATGPLMATWPTRTNWLGRYGFSLSIVIAGLCVLWAGSLYAGAKGTAAAKNAIRELPTRTAVVVYSTRRLALSGPGVNVQPLPQGSYYRYRYIGLRLLTARGERYYVLPVNWQRRFDATYVLRDNDNVRVELYAGVQH